MIDENTIRECKATLADRIWTYQGAEMELFDKVNEILGCEDHENCNREGFKWACDDTCTDDYDGSVEVIVNPEWPAMTREQADKILALGFCIVFESHGEEGRAWSKKGVGKCSTRSRTESSKLACLKVKLKDHASRIKVLEDLLRELQTPCDYVSGGERGSKTP